MNVSFFLQGLVNDGSSWSTMATVRPHRLPPRGSALSPAFSLARRSHSVLSGATGSLAGLLIKRARLLGARRRSPWLGGNERKTQKCVQMNVCPSQRTLTRKFGANPLEWRKSALRRSARMALERATAMRRVSDDPLPAPLSTSSSSSSSSVVRYKATLDPNFFLVGERCVPR